MVFLPINEVKKLQVKNYFLILLVVLLSSCVSQKDLLYLQDGKQPEAVVNAVKNQYRIQVNDILHISVKALDQNLVQMFATTNAANTTVKTDKSLYFDGYSVDFEGNIRIPVIGKLFVLGKTTEEIQNNITKKLLTDYFKKDTYLFVSAKLAGFRLTIQGEVGNAGTHVFYQDQVNIFELIANAGNINFVGDRKHVMLIRKTPNGQEIHSLDLTKKDILNSPYYYLEPNDMVYVKPLKQKSWGTGTTGTQTMTTVISVLSLITTVIILTR